MLATSEPAALLAVENGAFFYRRMKGRDRSRIFGFFAVNCRVRGHTLDIRRPDAGPADRVGRRHVRMLTAFRPGEHSTPSGTAEGPVAGLDARPKKR